MQLGTLHLTLPDWQTRTFAVEQPSLSIGRDPDNDLVIDEPSISRRHARLTFETGRLIVEDLGSSQGTFIGQQRLPANSPSLVPENQPIRLADIEIVFTPSVAQAPTQDFRQAVAGSVAATVQAPPEPGALIGATLAGPTQPVTPGSVATAQLTLHNRGSVTDEFFLHVSGLAEDWVRLSQEHVSLLPGAQAQVTVSFQPPRHVEAVAAEHAFSLTVTSRAHRAGVVVSGVLPVLPYPACQLNLQPVRGARDFQLVAVNQGNTPIACTLSGTDDEHALVFHFAEPSVSLAPGQTATVGLSVTPRTAPRIGTRETRAFSIVAQPVPPSSGAAARAAGQLIIRPPIPLWLIPLAVLLALCVCISAAYGFVTVCRTTVPDAPFCPGGVPPVINVLTATPGEVDQGGIVVIAWDVSNAEKVELVLPAPETLDASGLRTFTLSSNTTFTLRASNFAGAVEQSVYVNVRGSPPAIQTFTATPGVITAGQTGKIVLSWTTIGATEVTIEGVPGKSLPPAGSVEVPAPTADTTYTLIASNATGSVRQAVTVVLATNECAITGVVAPDRLNLRAGPAGGFAVVVQLENGTRVHPTGRNAGGDWLRLRAAGREGWVPAIFVACTGVTDWSIYPTVSAAQIPTLAPTPTVTPLPATATSVPPTLTPTSTPTTAPTPTPLFASGGHITYRVQVGARTTIYLQNASGAPIPLVFDKDDAEVLDFTANNGGRFAIWVLEGGQQKVFIINRSGQLIGSPITGGWSEITDGDWSYDGQRLVIEAVTAGATNYHFYDANGGALGQPALP